MSSTAHFTALHTKTNKQTNKHTPPHTHPHPAAALNTQELLACWLSLTQTAQKSFSNRSILYDARVKVKGKVSLVYLICI
jgi:hypothetical protein